MAPPSVRNTQSASGASAGSSAVVTKPTGLVVGDLLVGIAVCDNDGALANLTGPSWTLQNSSAAVAGGRPGIKIWTQVATSTETAASNFTFSSGTGIYCSAVVTAITTATFNSGALLSATPSFNGSDTSTTSHVAPSITPGVVDGLLICVFATDQGGAATNSYGAAGSMSEIADTAASSGFTGLAVDTLALASTSATGTQTATCSNSRPFNCASFIVNPVAGPSVATLSGAFLGIMGM